MAKEHLAVAEPLQFVEAKAGCGRALSFGPRPEFACDWLTLEGSATQDVEDALGWLLRLRHDWRAQGIDVWLEFALDRSGVRELS